MSYMLTSGTRFQNITTL